MPRLILHTGIHKTGTTTLQRALDENRAVLRRQGILYPRTGMSGQPHSWGQHELAYGLRDPARGRRIWAALRAEADAAGAPSVVVSSEELSLLPFPGLPGVAPYRLIAETFAGYEIRVLCYLRPQADLVASLYNHRVKSVAESGDILDFLPLVAPRLEYAQYLNTAAVALGEAAIRVRRYGRGWMRGDILDDVAAEIGLDLSQGVVRPGHDQNPGLTRAGMQAMLALNRAHAGDPARLARKRGAVIRAHAAPAQQSHDALGPEARRVIEALYRSKNRQIARRFLKLDGNLFDPDAPPLRPAAPAP